MKRFLLFVGDGHAPFGGWKDLVSGFDTLQEVHQKLYKMKKRRMSDKFWHIVDSQIGEIVDEG